MFKMDSEAMRQWGYQILTSDLEVMEVERSAAVATIIRVGGYTRERWGETTTIEKAGPGLDPYIEFRGDEGRAAGSSGYNLCGYMRERWGETNTIEKAGPRERPLEWGLEEEF
jgi:hypothetical protein